MKTNKNKSKSCKRKLLKMENNKKNFEERNPTPRESFSNALAKFEQRDSLSGGGPPRPLLVSMGACQEEERETLWQCCQRTVGCHKISTEDIRRHRWTETGDTTEALSASDLESGDVCKTVRIAAANELFNIELLMDTGKIKIEDAKMCTDPNRMVLWVTLKNKETAAKVFIVKSIVDTQVRVKIRFPAFAWQWLKFLKKLAAEKKGNNVYYQICPGLCDLQVFKRFGYKRFHPVSLVEFCGDKMDELPEFLNNKKKPTLAGRQRTLSGQKEEEASSRKDKKTASSPPHFQPETKTHRNEW